MSVDITVEDVKAICNLSDLRKTEVISSQFILVEAQLKEHIEAAAFKKMTCASAKPTSLQTSFKHAFAYIVYANIIDLLNTSTVGTGIIKSTGYSESRTELLGEDAADVKRQKLLLKAYELIKKQLNPEGLAVYEELKLAETLRTADAVVKPSIIAKGKRCRATLI